MTPRALDDLGPRICILGPSNSGKSTLAAAIGRARGLPVVHIDQLHHQPDSHWVPRPSSEFLALHDAAVLADRWVIEGNYLGCLPQRLAHATGLILLDISAPLALLRYLRRTLFERHRFGGLEGGTERMNWRMLHYVAIASRHNRLRYRARFDAAEVPRILLRGRGAIAAFYDREALTRRG